MTTRNVVFFAAAAALAGCASINSTASDQGPVRSALYVADQGPSATPAAAAGTATVAQEMAQRAGQSPGESKPMRIYWFLGGR